MTWFKVDDGLAFHPKAVVAGNAAMGLWVRAGAWSSQQLTDGFVPDHMIPSLGKPAQARALVTAGLWTREEGGYRFWQWDSRNPSRASVEAGRDDARERMRKAREAKGRSNVQPNNGTRSPEHTANVRANFGGSSDNPSRPVVVVGSPSHSRDVTREAETNSDLDHRIQDELQRHRRVAIPLSHVARVRADIASRTPTDVRDPTAYVLTAIRNEPHRYLPTDTPEPWRPLKPTGPPPADLHAAAQAARDAIRSGSRHVVA